MTWNPTNQPTNQPTNLVLSSSFTCSFYASFQSSEFFPFLFLIAFSHLCSFVSPHPHLLFFFSKMFLTSFVIFIEPLYLVFVVVAEFCFLFIFIHQFSIQFSFFFFFFYPLWLLFLYFKIFLQLARFFFSQSSKSVQCQSFFFLLSSFQSPIHRIFICLSFYFVL